jgi:hypothetical protein
MLCSSGAKGTWRCKLTAGISCQPCSVAVAGDPTAMLCSSGVGRSRDRELTTFLGIFFCCYALPEQNRTGSCIACSVAVLFSSKLVGWGAAVYCVGCSRVLPGRIGKLQTCLRTGCTTGYVAPDPTFPRARELSRGTPLPAKRRVRTVLASRRNCQ